MFANPYMLIGLGVAVLPLVIHLLSRARYRTVDWGAMMFLEGATAQSQSRRRPRQFLLLLVRVLIVALLALALARPEITGQYSRGPTSTPRAGLAVILLDCSASMAFDDNGHPRMELAKEAAQQLLSLHRGDRVSLVLMGQSQPRGERTPTTNLWEVGPRIEAADVGYGRADISHSLDDAIEAIEQRDAPTPGQLVTFYIVTDRQATNWKEILDAGDDWSAQWRQKIARVGNSARIVVIPVGSPESENLVVRSIDSVGGLPVAGQPVDIDVAVQNIGPVQWASLPLTLKVDNSPLPEQKINLAPDSVTTARFSLPGGFPDAGTHTVSAEIGRPSIAAAASGQNPPATPGAARPKAGGLAGDDRLEIVLDVQKPTRVLIIRGEEPAGAAVTGSQCLAAALTPFKTAKKRQADAFYVHVVRHGQWTGEEIPPAASAPKKPLVGEDTSRLDYYQVIVLCNVDQLDETQLAALEQFVSEGGGLLVVPGDFTRTDELERALYRDGAGILPAAIGMASAADWSEQTTIAYSDVSHPALRFLSSMPGAPAAITIGRYFATPRAATNARVLLRLASGEPLLSESPATAARRGKVMLLSTSLEGDWTTLPRSNLLVPLLQSVVRYLGESPVRRLNLTPGEPIEIPLDDVSETRIVRIKPPGQAPETDATLVRSGSDLMLRHSDTEMPGIYTVRVVEPGRTQSIQVAVTPSRDESNLTPLTTAEWKRLERVANVQKLDPSVQPISMAAALPAPLEIWPYALGAVFLLGILEMKLSPRTTEADENAM
jgi:hypothetical protein